MAIATNVYSPNGNGSRSSQFKQPKCVFHVFNTAIVNNYGAQYTEIILDIDARPVVGLGIGASP